MRLYFRKFTNWFKAYIFYLLNSLWEEKSSLGIFVYRAIENRLVAKMYALLMNFFLADFEQIEISLCRLSRFDRKIAKNISFYLLFLIFSPAFYCHWNSRDESSYKYVGIAEWWQVVLKEKDNLFRCLLEFLASFLKIYSHFALKTLCISIFEHLPFK